MSINLLLEKEYLEIKEKYFLYKDCKELHPITFDWAKIFDVESNDKISIFENLKEVLNPSFYDKYLGSSDEGLKLNPKFKELFDAIESDDNDEIIDPQELEEAVTDITIKKLTSKYIVKHPSEWKYEKDKWGSIEEILEKEEDKKHFENENKRIKELQFFDDCKDIEDFPENDEVYHINPIGFVGEFIQKNKCYCLEQRIISSSCNGDGLSILNEHYEKLANELGVEKEVLKAVATVETGSRGAFQREKPKHATILYERHYFRNLITSVSKTNNSNGTITITGKAFLEGLEKTKAITISSSLPIKEIERKMRKIKIEAAAYFSNKYPDLIGSQGNYGTFNSQLVKLKRAKLLDEGKAIQSCSWGRFQVMGKYYNLVYNTPQELEKSQNQCELQHLVLFKEYLKNFDVIEPMKNKNWHLIARRYNGPSYAINNYHIKMENEYNKYKKEW